MSTEGKTPEELAKEVPVTDPAKVNAPVVAKAEKPAAKPAAKPRAATKPAEVEEVDRFADVRELAQKNHDAEVARNKANTVKEDTSVKTELEAKDQESSRNPEQVRASSKFPEAK